MGNMMAAIKKVVKDTWFNTNYMVNKRKKYTDYIRAKYDYDNNPSLICSNCIGGIIYNNLGLRFLSPTINLWMTNKDLIKLVSKLEEYVAEELVDNGEYEGYPTGKLKDITLYFNHYPTFEEAKTKWNERKQRINFDNLYVMLGDDGLSYEDIKALNSLHCKRMVVFTAKQYPELDFTFQLKKYEKESHVGFFAVRSLDGFREFEKEFDYVNWLNGESKLESTYQI